MFKQIKQLLVLISILALTTNQSQIAFAIDVDPNPTPLISSLNVSDSTFDASKGETTTFSYTLEENADIEAYTINLSTNDRVYFANDVATNSGNINYNWDGTDDSGTLVESGDYEFRIFASQNGAVVDSDFVEVTVNNTLSTIPLNCSSSVIKDFELNPDNDWDPTKEELDIEFDLEQDVDDLRIQALKGNEIIEIADESSADEDDYEESWDGEDDDGDYIENGTWDIEVIADNYKCVETIDVEYEEPQIKDAVVTKESFDLDYGEFTSLLFELDEDGIVTVEVYDGSKRVETLLDEEELEGDAWHEVYFDGTDDDGDELDDDEKYEFRITAESIGNSDDKDTQDVNFEIEEDDSSNRNVNIYGDYLEPAIFDPQQDDSITIYYCLEDASDVTIQIYDGENASGSEEAELITDYSQSAGCHTVQWDGTNDNNRSLTDDIYSYKITAQSGSSKDTEKGVFVVGEFEDGGTSSGGHSNSNVITNSGPLVTTNGISLTSNSISSLGSSCGGFWDTNSISDDELCSAINWAVSYGIINGNADGSLKPYNAINRAETVKMVFSLYPQITLESAYGNTDFIDIDTEAWYAPYILTAQKYQIMQGYKNSLNKYEARASQTVTRAEVLKIVYTAAQQFAGYNYNFGINAGSSLPWYSPYENLAYQQNIYNSQTQVNFNSPAQRQEVIVFLYRLSQAGLL